MVSIVALVTLVWYAAAGPFAKFGMLVLLGAVLIGARAAALIAAGRLRRQWPTLALLVPLWVGLAFSCELTSRSMHRKSISPMLDAVCSADGPDACDAALQSRWAKLGNLHTSVLGLVYFEFLLTWFVWTSVLGGGRVWHAVPSGVAAAGLCVSGWLAWVLLAKLPAACPQCLVVHVANGVTGLVVLLMWLMPRADAPAARWPAAGAATVGLLLALVAPQLFMPTLVSNTAQLGRLAAMYKGVTQDVTYVQLQYERSPYQPVPVRPDDPMLGPADAPHRLVVFSDVVCEACAHFEKVLHDDVLPQYGDRLQVVFKHLPLSSECNPTVSRKGNARACEAAYACEAARSVAGNRGFWAMRGQLVKQRQRLAEEPYLRIANEVGIDGSRVAAEMSSSAVRQRVAEDVALAQRLRAVTTPTLFLNGRRLKGWRNSQIWKILLTAEPPRGN